jgi:Zn-dependent M28 family amino/carboxypeptidase
MSLRLALALLLLIPASCKAGADPANAASFSAERAFEHARKMVEMGPRPSGSNAIKGTQAYLEAELKSSGLKVIEDAFTASTPKGAIPMKNIIGEVSGKKPDIVMITGHYDTKLQDGFVGANDGASSAATVLELAHVLAKSSPEYTLWFVLFDGEEAVVDWNAMNGLDNTYGSRHLASSLSDEGRIHQVKAMILVDMIGDKNLNLKREGESTSWLVNLIWETARSAGFGKFFLQAQHYISDDHLPFRDEGVPVADLIDFDYGPNHSYWHTNDDTLDKISGESMKVVGDVIIRVLPELFKRLNEGLPPVRRPSSAA